METTTATFKFDPDLIDRAADRVEANWYNGPNTRSDDRPDDTKCECAYTSIATELVEAYGPASGSIIDQAEDAYLRLFVQHWDLTVHHGAVPAAVFRWNDAQPNGKVVADAMRDVATWLRRTQR